MCTQTQEVHWLRHYCLYLPARLQEAQQGYPPELRYVVRYLSYTALLGERASLQQIIDTVRAFKLTDCIELFSKIESALEYDGSANFALQKRLGDDLLPSELVNRIPRQTYYLYFFKQQILSMMKLILIHNTDRPRRRLMGQRDIRQTASCSVMLNDHLDSYNTLTGWDTLTDEQREERLIEFFVRALAFQDHGDLHAFPRYYYLFFKIPEMPQLRQSQNYINVNWLFQKTSSFDLPTYFILGFAIVAWFHQSILRDFSLDRVFITPFQFSSMDIPPAQARRILSHLSDTSRGFRQKLTEHMDDHKRLFWDFLEFRQKPLLNVNRYRSFVPLSTGFLKQKVTENVYWTLLDALPGDQGNRLTRFFGEIFQHYAEQQFEVLFPASNLLPRRLFFEQEYGSRRNPKKTTDIMVIYPDAAIFVEVKVSRLRYDTVITGSMDRFDAYLDEVILKAAKQLDRTIHDFWGRQFVLDGVDPTQIRRCYPVILTLINVPQETFIWKRIDRYLKQQDYFTDADVMPLQLIDAEELEMLDPILRSGTSLLDIIHAHSQPGEREFSLRNFFYAQFRDVPKDSNTLLQAEIDELHDRILQRFR